MQNGSSSNVRDGKLPLRTFFVFGIILLMVTGITWWVAKTKYDNGKLADTVFDKLDSTIREMNHLLLTDNKMKANEMTSWLNYPELSKRAQLWKPKLDSVVWLGVAFHDYMQSYRANLLYDLNYQKANKVMFDGIKDSALSLQQRLISILPEDKRQYLQNSLVEKELKSIADNDNYNGLSLSGRVAVLTRIEHSVLELTNKIGEIISQQSAFHPLVYDAFDVLIGQNTTYLLPGQTLEITAGLGTYSTSVKPEVSINGEVQPLNNYGVGLYRRVIDPNDKGGSVSVSVLFKDPNSGEMKSKATMLTYTVFKPSKH